VYVRRMVPLVLVLLLSLAVLPAATRAQEAPPQSPASPEASPALIYPLFNYQGRLVEGGAPVTGSRSMTFRLWTAPSGGGTVWTEGPKTVAVSNGLFTVTLGDTSTLPLNWFAYDLWLEVQIGAVTLPRQQLMGAPYALSLAPGSQVVGSKTASDPPVVTVQNVSNGEAIKGYSAEGWGVHAESGSGTALYALNSSSLPTLQVTNNSATGQAAQVDSNGTYYAAMVTNSYAGVNNQGGVLRLMTNGGRVILAQNKSFSQLFSVEANGDVTQSLAAGGLVKVAISASCGDSGSAIQRYYTQGVIPTVADGASVGTCTINPGFDPSARYWSVTAPTSGAMRMASCNVVGTQLGCIRTDASGAGINGTIQVLIY
jgi:hypothetical protein